MSIRFEKKALTASTAIVYEQSINVYFQHVDAAGVVFFARYFEYIHEAYEGFLASIGTPLSDVLREQRWAAPLTHVEADYFRPLRFGDKVSVQLVAASTAGSQLSLGWRLMCAAGSGSPQPAAVLQSTHTFVSAEDFQRTAVPEQILAALASVLTVVQPATVDH